MTTLIEEVADLLSRSSKTIALTGAGISVESGIPPFRGKGGVWEKIDPMKFAHIDAFTKDPVSVWNVLIKGMKDLLDKARPNDGHKGLARLEELGILTSIITQNVDGLHQVAGNTDVIEFHGSFIRHFCSECNRIYATTDIKMTQIPPRCDCNGILRPDIVFFGEMIPPAALMRSQQLAETCDVMLVVGTSAFVQPAAYIPVIAKQNGAVIVEINPESTPLTNQVTDLALMGNAGETMNRVLGEIEKRIS
ncbi:MAG: NAD-dependent deacylase [Desulfobacteraceae bacterium]|nr:NAD-dependent deacylase [Desulfobacteraceae bacterium]